MRRVKDRYEDARIMVASYMAYQDSEWIEAAWKKIIKDGKLLTKDVMETLAVYGNNAAFNKDGVCPP